MTTSTPLRTCVLASAVLSLPTLASAQVLTNALVEGDSIVGLGLVTTVTHARVNSSGDWLIEVATDFPDATMNAAIVDPSVVVREGQAAVVPGFPTATIRFFDSIELSENGDRSHNHSLNGTASGSDDTGVFYNDTLLIQQSGPSASTGFSPGTIYTGFFETQLNESNQVCLIASVDDPMISSTTDRAIVILTVDAMDNLVSETVVAKEGDVLPGQALPATDFETASHEFCFNGSGSVMYTALFGTGGNDAIYVDTTLVAIEGGTDPVTGRVWDSLGSKPVALNDLGEFAFRGNLDGDTATDEIIVKNNTTKVVQEGDSLPDIAPFVLTSFGSGPIFLGDNGSVLWYGDWDDPDLDVDTGIFLDGQLVLQEGDVVDGMVVDTIRGITDGYSLSDDGSYAIIRVQYVGGIDAAILIDFSDPFPAVCNGDGGDQLGCTDCPCGNNATAGTIGGCLNSAGTASRLDASGDVSVSLPPGDTTDLRFTMSGGPAVATSVLLSGDAVAPTNMANPCFGLDSGAQSIDRDGLRCAVQNVQRHGNRQTNAMGDIMDSSGASRVWGGEAQPNDGLAVQGGFAAGQTRYFQVTHRDDPMLVCMRGLNTSQAVEVTFEP